MDEDSDTVGRSAEAPASQAQQQLSDLADAEKKRHQLAPGSPEYEAALEDEEILGAAIWRRERLTG
jgi:hypothetical protein